jgi:gliding motility-associated-like protein
MSVSANRYYLFGLFLGLICCCASFTTRAQTADFSISKKEGCIPLSGVNFTDISSGGTVVRRDWNLGNGNIISNGPATVGTNYLTDGTFTITLTVTFSNGDVKTKQDVVTVHPKPVAAFTGDDVAGCAPHAVQFTSQSTTATGSIATYLWDFGAGGSSDPNPSFTYNSNGNYNVSLIVTNNWGCTSDAAIKTQYIQVYPKVNASFTIPAYYSCDTPLTTTFVNTSTGGGIITYLWDFGDGQTSTDANPTHTYTSTGAYTVTLTAKNGTNCISTSVHSNAVLAGKPKVGIAAPDTICSGTSPVLYGNITPAAFISTVKWLFPDNNATQYGQNVSHTFTTPGTYDIVMIAYNAAGCNDTAHHNIYVRPAAQADFSMDRTVGCSVPFTVQFTDHSSPTDHLKYDWNFGDGVHDATTNPAHTYNSFGNYTVTLTITDTTTGCTAFLQKPNVIRIQQPQVDFTYTPHDGCKPLPVKATARLSNLVDPVVSYVWDFGDGYSTTTTVDNASHTYTAAGGYNITLKIITAQGCTVTSIGKPVDVADLCDDDGSGDGGGGGGGGDGFTIGKTCNDKYTITFTDTLSNTVPVSWNFGDGSPLYTTPPLNPVTHTFPATATKYVVTLTRKDTITGNVTNGQVRMIIIDEHANFAPDITDICNNKTVNFHTIGIDSSHINKYTWDFGDGTPRYIINNKNYYASYGLYLNGNTSHQYTDTGVFYVKLIIEDKLGCIDSFQYAVPVTVKGPAAGFKGAPLTTCDPSLPVNFTDTSKQNGSTPIVEWDWNFGDGSPVYTTTQDTALSHTYFNNSYVRFYTVSLTIKDAIGCAAQATYNSYIKAYQPKAAFYSYDTLKCGSTSIFVYNNSSAYNASYQWNFGDGATSAGYNGTHTYSTNGQYDIKLVVKDENGCMDSVTAPAYIKLVKPKADYSAKDTSNCAPVGVLFADSSLYANKYVWDFGDGGTGSTDKDPSRHIYPVPGYYPVTLHITGVSGCIDSITKIIHIKGPIGQLHAGNSIGCTPYTLPLRVTGSNISTYAWDYGDGTPVNTSPADSVVNHVYPLAGKFLPNIVLTSPEGCPFTLKATDSIIVDSAHAAFNIDRPLRCFIDRAVQFTNQSATAFGAVSYKWLFGDGQESAQTNPLHTYSTDGTYDIKLIVNSFYGCADTLMLPKGVQIHQQPVAAFQADSLYCSPALRVYHNNSTSADRVAQYAWYVDDQRAAITPDLSYALSAGIHQLALVVTTNVGCIDSLATRVTVDSIVANFTIDRAIRCGDDRTIAFTNLSQGHLGIASYAWDFGDTNTGTDASPTHTYAAPGSYPVKVVATSTTGCTAGFTAAAPVKIFTKPVVQINGEVKKCAQQSIGFHSNINSEDEITQCTWKLNDSAISSADTASHYFDNAGSYDLSFTVNTKYGCQVTDDTAIVIHALPVPAASPKDTTVCIGSLVPLQAHDGLQYNWQPVINLQNATTATAIATAMQATWYYVTVTNTFGCVQKDSVHIVVDEKVRLQHSDNVLICRGDQTRLKASGNTSHFEWMPVSGLNSPHSASTVASPDQTTNYQVVGYSRNTCPNDTGFVLVTVADLPVVDLGPDRTVDAGQVITLSPAVSANVVNYNWWPATGLNCTNCNAPQFVADKDIVYHVRVTTQYGCESQDDVRIIVACGKGAVYIPNAFTPNGDGKNDVFYIKGYGIQQVKSFRIFNRWGQLVFQRENFLPNDRSFGWDGTFNGRPADPGAFVYITEVICNEGKPIVEKGTVVLIR